MNRATPLVVTAGIAMGLTAPSTLTAQQADSVSCPEGDPSHIEVGLTGVVRDDESGLGLPGATVRLTYLAEAGRPTPGEVTVQADEVGQYNVCGLEAFRKVRVRARYLGRAGKARTIALESTQDIDLIIDLGNAAFLIFTVADASTGAPVRGATVDLTPIRTGGITDSLGRAAFRGIPPGDYQMNVRHIGYAERTDTIEVKEGQLAELRVELVAQAIALEPLEVKITGRDPYLLDNGFYERQQLIGKDGYFGTRKEIESYTMIGTLFQFKKELSIRFARKQFVLLNGRPISRLGYRSIRELREVPYSRIRGIEAYSCSDAPDEIMIQVRAEVPIGDCNLIAIWTR